MTTATVSSKGQTTIPKAVRRHLGLKAGDRVEFLITPEGHAVLLARNLRPGDLRGILPRPTQPATVEQMHDAAIDAAVESATG